MFNNCFWCVFCAIVCLWTFYGHCVPIQLTTYDIWGDQMNSSVSRPQSHTNDNNAWTKQSEHFINIPKRNSKVLNFFPVPVDDECISNDQRRPGVCLNPYECRIQNGESRGQCALGFGVCCIFTAHCDMEIYNNITYIVSPNFPALSRGVISCKHRIKKIDPEISQLRLDFLHFVVGQPNRQTGACENEVLTISGGNSPPIRMCGINSGQHVYFDVENINEPVEVTMNFTKTNIDRMWEIKVTQIPFNRRAPAGCLQYNTGRTGLIQTMNFADNGRHLSDQEYTICTRQEKGMCSITYEPCDENSFKIGPNAGGGTGGILGSLGGSFPGGGDQAADGSDGVINLVEEFGSGGGPISAREDERLCSDRILLPCDSEEFIMPGTTGPGTCDIAHCGGSLCPPGNKGPCRVESTITPFNIRIEFGPAARIESPEENLGMCLKYEQQPCAV